MKQKIFNFKFSQNNNIFNFYVNSTNIDAYNSIINDLNNNLFLTGPRKSGKSFLGEIWLKKYKAIKYNLNFDYIINNNQNVLIDDISTIIDEEKIFHILNHCLLNKLRILIISKKNINELNFNLDDLISRLKELLYLKINQPDDNMLRNLLMKLLTERQFVLNKDDIFEFILKRAKRSYQEMLVIVEKLDNLSLEKKRQLTIPLIKEIL